MGFFGLLKNAAGNLAGIKMLQTGSDVLIGRHTRLNVFNLPPALRKRANEHIKHLFLNTSMKNMCGEEAAILKLIIFYKAAEGSGEGLLIELFGESITSFRNACEAKIRPEILFQTLAETGR